MNFKYITVEELKKIIKEVRANYTKREEVIVRLMFENGLFLDEILKIKDTDIVKQLVNGKKVYCLYIKNRRDNRDYLFWGTNRIILSETLYNLIREYINQKDNTQNVNNYLFLNDKGKPLTVAKWNKTLKEIFKACDIEFDEDEDLNVRFRHGFAMFALEHCDYTATQFKDLLRFINIHSIKIYPITPKMQEELDALDLFAKKFFRYSIKA